MALAVTFKVFYRNFRKGPNIFHEGPAGAPNSLVLEDRFGKSQVGGSAGGNLVSPQPERVTKDATTFCLAIQNAWQQMR